MCNEAYNSPWESEQTSYLTSTYSFENIPLTKQFSVVLSYINVNSVTYCSE